MSRQTATTVMPAEYLRTHAGKPLPCPRLCADDLRFALRFWAKVDFFAGEGACWEWQAVRKSRGYGQFKVAGTGMVLAHRVAFMLHNGRWPHCDLLIRHACNNPKCCNPAHLIEGTPAENMADREAHLGYRAKNQYGTYYAFGKGAAN